MVIKGCLHNDYTNMRNNARGPNEYNLETVVDTYIGT